MRSNIYFLQDVASNGRNALSYYSQFGSSPEVLKLLLEAHLDGAKNEDASKRKARKEGIEKEHSAKDARIKAGIERIEKELADKSTADPQVTPVAGSSKSDQAAAGTFGSAAHASTVQVTHHQLASLSRLRQADKRHQYTRIRRSRQ